MVGPSGALQCRCTGCVLHPERLTPGSADRLTPEERRQGPPTGAHWWCEPTSARRACSRCLTRAPSAPRTNCRPAAPLRCHRPRGAGGCGHVRPRCHAAVPAGAGALRRVRPAVARHATVPRLCDLEIQDPAATRSAGAQQLCGGRRQPTRAVAAPCTMSGDSSRRGRTARGLRPDRRLRRRTPTPQARARRPQRAHGWGPLRLLRPAGHPAHHRRRRTRPWTGQYPQRPQRDAHRAHPARGSRCPFLSLRGSASPSVRRSRSGKGEAASLAAEAAAGVLDELAELTNHSPG